MKILHIIGNASFGGIERLVITLVKQQLDAGKVVPAIMLSGKSGEFLDKFEQTGARLLLSHCESGYKISPALYKSVLVTCKEFDVLHFHYFNPFIAWCAVRSGKKIVYTEHGNFGFGRRITTADKVKNFLKKHFLNSEVDYIVFNSEFTRQVSEDRFGLSGTNRSTVYNGVDVSEVQGRAGAISPDIRARLGDAFVVGTSSRFAGFKRIDRLIEAFARIHRSHSDMVLLLVGDGPTRPGLESMVDTLGIADKVVFAGYRGNVYDYQSAMDLCVFASVNEPFGLVAVEALLLGKPTLVFSDGGGLKEIIGGLSRNDVVEGIDQLCSRIEFYYQHPAMLEEQKTNRVTYARRFDAEIMSDGYYEIYEKIV